MVFQVNAPVLVIDSAQKRRNVLIVDDFAVCAEELFAVQASIVHLKVMRRAHHTSFGFRQRPALLMDAVEFAQSNCFSPFAAHWAVIPGLFPSVEALLAR